MILVLAVLTLLVASPAQAQTAPELIERWYEQENLCRGLVRPDPRIDPACKRRDMIGAQLERLGLCYGILSYGYNSKWEICSPSKGQIVTVKNIGQMNLSAFNCRLIDRSSFIGRVCHNIDRDILVVLVNGTYYAYCEVAVIEAMAFVAARSMGQYFNANFRGKKECR